MNELDKEDNKNAAWLHHREKIVDDYPITLREWNNQYEKSRQLRFELQKIIDEDESDNIDELNINKGSLTTIYVPKNMTDENIKKIIKANEEIEKCHRKRYNS